MIEVLLNGQPARVRNLDSIGFRTSFTDDYTELELNVDTLTFVNESRNQILDWIFGATSAGAFVGIPLQVKYKTLVFDYYVDLSQRPLISDDEIQCKIYRRKGTDAFFDLANGSTFEYLRARGVQFATKQIPYVIIRDNQVEQGIALSLALFSMTQAALQAVRDTAIIAADFVAALDVSPAHAISAGAKLAAQALYTAALVYALIDLAKQLRELVFPKIRYFKGVNVKTLIQQSCAELGYTFESSILDELSALTILPVPLVRGKQSIFNFKQDELTTAFTKGYPTSSDTVPTLGALFSALEVTFNAVTRVNNGVVRLEQVTYWQDTANLSSVPALNIQDERKDTYTLNTDEAWKRYYIHYQTDYSDIHTLDIFDPNTFEAGTKNNNLPATDLDMLKGLRDVDIPFSLGVRKSQLNFIETLALNIFSVIDALTGVNTTAIIQNRIGVLQISEQFFSNTKLMYTTVDGKQPSNYLSFIGADNLYNSYHAIENIQINGWKEYENAPLLLNFEQFSEILNNNYININNELCEIRSIEFVPYQAKATITYRTPLNYANGKITTFVISE